MLETVREPASNLAALVRHGIGIFLSVPATHSLVRRVARALAAQQPYTLP